MLLDNFLKSIITKDTVGDLRAGIIGENLRYKTPFGQQTLIYADYTASGRALQQVEDFVSKHVLPYYANSHTTASFCGAYITDLREKARQVIADQTNAGPDCSVIFAGSGATAAVNRLVALTGISNFTKTHNPSPIDHIVRLCGIKNVPTAKIPTVFIGPYEHHSNILPWRESGADVVEIAEGPDGGPDLIMLEQELIARQSCPLLIGSFSAASNVSGIITDIDAVTALLKKHGALAFWDYAGGGPYLTIDMNPGKGLEKDAVFLSPHKFPGGPGASGLLIIRNSTIVSKRPTWPGGGSVSYVSPWGHNYLDSVIEREEAGTPNIIGDIRAALVFLIKAAIGQEFITAREQQLGDNALAIWRNNPNLHLLGTDRPNRLPIFSFAVRDNNDGYVHHQLFTRMLSDITGIQARGGCVCAGPYGHLLLDVERKQSEKIRNAILIGQEIEKPGWVRLNFNYLMDDTTASSIIKQVDKLAGNTASYSNFYVGDTTNANFTHRHKTFTQGSGYQPPAS